MKVCQPSVAHKNPVVHKNLCCSSLPISEVKHSCTGTKTLVASPVVTAMKQKLSLWTDVQYCDSVWEVFLKSCVTPEKKASSCAGLTTVHHKSSALAFFLGSYPSPILFSFQFTSLRFCYFSFLFLSFFKRSIFTVPYSSGRPVLTTTGKKNTSIYFGWSDDCS